MYNSLTKR
jgi:predicted amidohydrolase